MVCCHDLKKGEIYLCEDCGIQLEVKQECREHHEHPKGGCCEKEGQCVLACGDKKLVIKTS
jgi:hypothetical protein